MKEQRGPGEALERLMRESAPRTFRPGFSGRVMARLAAGEAARGELDPFATWTWRLFPRVAIAASLLAVGLAAWNLGAQREGTWLDRLVSLPAVTLDNSLSLMEDFS
jgi:hypothetical protein